jgi:hypothetical protein
MVGNRQPPVWCNLLTQNDMAASLPVENIANFFHCPDDFSP